MKCHVRLPNTFVLRFAILALIIGFVLIVGGAFAVLQQTEAIDSWSYGLTREVRSWFANSGQIDVREVALH